MSVPMRSILCFEHREHVVFLNTLSGVLRTSQSVSLGDAVCICRPAISQVAKIYERLLFAAARGEES
jgi:hypothetical protein